MGRGLDAVAVDNDHAVRKIVRPMRTIPSSSRIVSVDSKKATVLMPTMGEIKEGTITSPRPTIPRPLLHPLL
jgi:hypothetical protein